MTILLNTESITMTTWTIESLFQQSLPITLLSLLLLLTTTALLVTWQLQHDAHLPAKRTYATRPSDAQFSVLITSKSRDAILVRRLESTLSSACIGAMPPLQLDVTRAVANLFAPRTPIDLHFVSVLPDTSSSSSATSTPPPPLVANDAALRFAGDECASGRFVWLFVAECAEDALLPDQNLHWRPIADLVASAYDKSLHASLAVPMRWFGNASFAASPRDALRLVAKHTPALMPDPRSASLADLRDFSLLDSCMYTFDQPGKGVRSGLVRSLALHFHVDHSTLARLCSFIEQFHQLSLMIDDIQDVSDLRRNRACAHVRFGVPETIGAAYTQLFRLMAEIPTAFPVRSAAVTELVVDGCRACHRGQALDVTWRERRYCPSVAEWLDMARGKTAAPFELAARLVFLQASPLTRLRLWAARALLRRNIEEEVVRLCADVGVYFQIRDDYINLTDEEYWKSHGVADDLHEKKFSYPICVMVERRLPGYDALLQLFASTPGRLAPDQVLAGLELIKRSGALDATNAILTDLRAQILHNAEHLQISAFSQLMKKLS
jgi:geranylgeranyl diphosphate synthase type 3